MCVFNTYYCKVVSICTFYLLDKFRLFEKRLCIKGRWQPIAHENVIKWNWSSRSMYLKGLILKHRLKGNCRTLLYFLLRN